MARAASRTIRCGDICRVSGRPPLMAIRAAPVSPLVLQSVSRPRPQPRACTRTKVLPYWFRGRAWRARRECPLRRPRWQTRFQGPRSPWQISPPGPGAPAYFPHGTQGTRPHVEDLTMKLERSIAITAPPDTVWSVLADIERWPEWTASMTTVQPLDPGGLAAGARVRIKQPRLPPLVWRVTALEPGRSFDWVARSPGATTVARHRIEPRA